MPSYELEPLWRRREWELDAARLGLAGASSALALAERRLETLQVRFAAGRTHASRRAQDAGAFSLHSQRVAVAYFGALLRAIESAGEEVRRLDAERERAMRDVLEASVAFEAVDRHRAGALAEHESATRRKELASADEAWTQRAGRDAVHE